MYNQGFYCGIKQSSGKRIDRRLPITWYIEQNIRQIAGSV